MSRKTIAHPFHSLDGVVEGPHLWQFDAFGEEDGVAMDTHITPVTDAVIGRQLWTEWSQYWPNAGQSEDTDDFAAWVNPVRKHVVSSTLGDEHPDGLPWNSTLITGDPVDYVRKLRETAGGDIAVLGGITTVRTMFLAGVIDELTLTTHPVIAGTGRHLFDDTVPTTRLRLLNESSTSTGNAVLTYGLRPTD